ncbi:hypothetical protein [Streptomyces sp. CB01373]|uniref:hypothetical protein n=1 Tax=Streptomyces sp. CB01373 TaxID=2020325 RepID=UPI001F215760|nr:hypothetical protein [Streptomyces sp. CB01373]
MSARPRLKSITTTPDGLRAAQPATPPAAVGEPKDVARKGVRTALRSDRYRTDEARHGTDDPTPARPGIRIYAPPVYRDHWDGARWSKRYGDTPTAAYACACGQTGTAAGPRAVAALVSEYAAHKSGCAGASTTTRERRAAA